MENIDIVNLLISISILLVSVIIHEVAHAVMADKLGDPTARLNGRITLNPLAHLDPVGSVLVPILAFATTGFVFGWAKPVGFNPYNLKNRRRDEALIAAAGPLSNLAIVAIFILLIKVVFLTEFISSWNNPVIMIAMIIIVINLVLAFFNLIPIPPLDGSKILFSFFPESFNDIRAFMERYSIILLMVFIFSGWSGVYINWVLRWIFSFINLPLSF